MNMQAAVLSKIGRPLRIVDVPVPEVSPDEVLIETRACGICRTDLHIQDGLAYVPSLPHIPGHEPAGVVARVGQNVTNLQVGRRVVPHLFVRSTDCCYSRIGRDAQAIHLEGILGVTLPGGFAEYFKAPARNLLVLPDEVPFDVGGLTSCAVITAVHAFRLAGLQSGDTAVVLGAGGIGQILIQLLSFSGIRVVAVGRSSESLDLAVKSGASMALSAESQDLVERVRSFAGKEADGAHVVFELVGLAQTMKLAADLVRRCGKIIVIGEEAEQPAIDTIRIAQRELQIIGSRNGGMQDANDALSWLANGVIRPPIAARFPLARINEAFDLVRHGGAHGRVVVTFEKQR